MLSNERERLERREAAKADAVETVEANRVAAAERLADLRKEAGYPQPVVRNEVGEAVVTDSEEEETEEVKPYGEWTNEELSNELKDRDLPHSGNKDELVARLEESDKAEESE